MGVLDQIAKRMALKTANIVEREIPTAAERTMGALVPTRPSGLQQAARAVEEGKIARPITNNVEKTVENPSRRSFLKKAASTAARASVPDNIAGPLMSYAAKKSMTEVPDLVEAVVKNVPKVARSGVFSPKLLSGFIREIADFHGVPVEEFASYVKPEEAQLLGELASKFNNRELTTLFREPIDLELYEDELPDLIARMKSSISSEDLKRSFEEAGNDWWEHANNVGTVEAMKYANPEKANDYELMDKLLRNVYEGGGERQIDLTKLPGYSKPASFKEAEKVLKDTGKYFEEDWLE